MSSNFSKRKGGGDAGDEKGGSPKKAKTDLAVVEDYKAQLEAIRAQYTDPMKPELKIADEATIQAYHALIRTYKLFWPLVISAGGNIGVIKEQGGDLVKMSDDEYAAYAKTPASRQGTYVVGKPIEFKEIRNESHVYSFKKQDDSKLDELDRLFVTGPKSHGFASFDILGLHTYGGYYGFFRPDLFEVIHLLHTKIKPAQLPKIRRLYVTTEPHPSDKGSECYDSGLDRHRAKTTCFVVWKPEH